MSCGLSPVLPQWASGQVSALKAADLGSIPVSPRVFSRSSHTSDLTIRSSAAILPGTCSCWVSAGTSQPGSHHTVTGRDSKADLKLLSQGARLT